MSSITCAFSLLFILESFYRSMRKRFEILMEADKPFGGQWNFDQKNRQAYDQRVPIPQALLFENDARDVCQSLRKMKVQTFGEIED